MVVIILYQDTEWATWVMTTQGMDLIYNIFKGCFNKKTWHIICFSFPEKALTDFTDLMQDENAIKCFQTKVLGCTAEDWYSSSNNWNWSIPKYSDRFRCVTWMMWKVNHIFSCTVFRAFGAILKRNPKMFFWSDEEKLSWMFLIFLDVLI